MAERGPFPESSALVGSAITLGIGWVVAIGFLVHADLPSRVITDVALPDAFALVAMAAPVGLLLSRGEVDLSFFGTAFLAGYIFRETGSSSIGVGILAAVAAGLAVGATVGLARWLTRAPSAYVSLAGGLLLTAIASKLLGDSFIDRVEGRIEGTGLPALVGLGFTALAVLWALASRPSTNASTDHMTDPGPGLILGYGLSGAGAGASGALFTSFMGSVTTVAVGTSTIFLALFAALAVGGVVRSSGFTAPLAAALGAFAVRLLWTTVIYENWEYNDGQLLLAALLVVCLLVAYLLPRLVSLTASSGAPERAPPG